MENMTFTFFGQNVVALQPLYLSGRLQLSSEYPSLGVCRLFIQIQIQIQIAIKLSGSIGDVIEIMLINLPGRLTALWNGSRHSRGKVCCDWRHLLFKRLT